MPEDYINVLFGEEDPTDDLALYNNVTDYYNNSHGQSGSGGASSQSTYTSIKNLIRSRANSASGYVKNLMGSKKSEYEAYNNLVYTDTLPYQKTPANAYIKTPVNPYIKTPVTKQKGPFGQEISPPSTPPLFRPMAPGGVRTPTTQSGMGQTRDVIRMADSGYHHDRKYTTVEYMDEARRSTFVVTMGSTLTRRGKVLDTAQIKRKYDNGQIGTALTFDGASPASQRIADKWRQMAMIWVCASPGPGQKPIFYSGVGRLNKVHHSSFTSGSEVIGAGEWIVENGKLTGISAVSGHYMPTWEALFAAILHMNQALNDKTMVLMFNVAEKAWVERSAREFISSPTQGGRFKVHPRA